jgi:hypothetical protein
MTVQEAKELELFKEWFSSACLLDMEVYLAAEQAWIARSKLVEKQDISSIPKDRRIIGVYSNRQIIVHWNIDEYCWCGDQYGLYKNPIDEPLYWQELPKVGL